MTFDGFDFTCFDTIKHTFPSLDKHVSVENGIFYLSLLEQFVQLRAEFADELDAFHARAELRYEAWIQGCQRRHDDHTLSSIIPPIDVAYISHAHLVSPFRFYEDCQRMMPHMLFFPLPLKQLHLQRHHASNESITFWNDECVKGKEPFTLTMKELRMELPGYRDCPLCKKCFKLSGLDYGKWRTDPTVYLRCWFCEQEFNVHDAAIEQIVSDLTREKPPHEKDVAWIRGTMLNNKGTIKTSVTETGSTSITQRLRRIITHYSYNPQDAALPSPTTTSSSNSSSRAMCEFIENSVRRKTTSMYDVEPILLRQLHFRALEQEYTTAEEKQKQRKIKDLAYAINACYGNNPSPFSLDLIQAAERQHAATTRILAMTWSLPDTLVLGVRHYKNFLLRMYEPQDWVGASTAPVDVAWRTHMLFPEDYRKFTLKHMHRVINHEDSIPHYSLEEEDEDDDTRSSSSYRRFSHVLAINHHRPSRYFPRVHPRPSFGNDYHHGSIVVDDPIDSLSLCGDHYDPAFVEPTFSPTREIMPDIICNF
ncbi:unnamed protein product [Absidia cylindrospora]